MQTRTAVPQGQLHMQRRVAPSKNTSLSWRVARPTSLHRQPLAAAASADGPPAAAVSVLFKSEQVSVMASPGEELMEVASRAGVTIPTGCWSGSCGVCEVEVRKYDSTPAAADAPPPAAVVRACITKLPPGYQHIEVDVLEDAIWGQDGFDT